MFDKILIANRGEIACRVMHTARRLGIRCVAVYSDADRHARHVELADEAIHIGPPPPAESYLRGEVILDAARTSGAQAVHPGYGFLSENAGFAEHCTAANLVFIGPPAAAIHAMGSKSEAKRIMERAAVPLVPGYHGDEQDPGRLADLADKIGYPVLIKASAGGGGKGMRVVERPADFAAELAAAQREARNAFGDDQVILEKYLLTPRHIEIQVFADHHDNAVYLFERDCSVQRRHQKVIEEAPAPGLTDAERTRMGETAVAAARAIGYVGAGTVEFIAAGGEFYFMEMNTRLQVEHPVTEMISGQDLVEWQLRVAAGEPVPRSQSQLSCNGHAFEARLYAEDPDREFLPATGRLRHLSFPVPSRHVRIDTGVRSGDEISIYYDPMIAKLIVWDRDRATALARLAASLDETHIAGVTTNVEFLSRIARHPAFAAGEVTTGFIAAHEADLRSSGSATPDEVVALAALYLLLVSSANARQAGRGSADPWSPWHRSDGWRLNEENFHLLHLKRDGADLELPTHFRGHGYRIDLPGGELDIDGQIESDGRLRANLGGRIRRSRVVLEGHDITVFHGGRHYRLEWIDAGAGDVGEGAGQGSLTSPMPGKVIQVLVQPGQQVTAGDSLLVLEAMKMEHTIRAPLDGEVRAVHYATGDLVEEGVELVEITPADG